MSVLADHEARETIRSSLHETLFVEAAAGTGKTTALVERMLALVMTGTTTLARIVAVTFTEKAAGEMKLRIRAEIERSRRKPDVSEAARARLDAALAELEAAHIGTIHGFCADLVRERPVEARVDPLFETADEDGQERLYAEAFERWFQSTLAEPPPGVRRVLRRATAGPGAESPRDTLYFAGLSLTRQSDFAGAWMHEPWGREVAMGEVLRELRSLGALGEKADYKDSWLAKNLLDIKRFVDEVDRREAIFGRDHDALEEELRQIVRGRRAKGWHWKGSGKWFAQGLLRDDVIAERARVRANLDAFVEAADADLAAALKEELDPLVREYERRKERAGKLDFLDLLVVARDMLRDHARVRAEMRARFTHILVDEFQDTDPLQAEILLLLGSDGAGAPLTLTPEPGKLFFVGDPKQSIYRFRRADVALYEMIKRRLVARGARVVHLSTSFRGVPSLQKAINAAFAEVMRGSEDGSQAEYVPLEAYREDPKAARPSLIALPVPKPYSDYGKITNYAVDASLPEAVGAFVDWMIHKSGWTITERHGEEVPIGARHVCLLFRRFVSFGRDITREYVRELEKRRIPHVLLGGRSFHAREEVLALRNAATAIEWPDDELSVFATLRGPFFALGDDALLAYRDAQGTTHPLAPVDAAKLTPLTSPVADALAILRKLHFKRNRRPIADTIARLLEETRAHAGVAIWPTGEQALANLLRVLDYARRFEAKGATSFRAFVRRLTEDADRGGTAEAPIVEEGTDGVRLMTVHKSKGLEFPVVILVDPTCPTTQREPSRFVDAERGVFAVPLAGCAPRELSVHRDTILRHDAEEAIRLAYVAATRAREILVVPVVGDERVPGWFDVLHPVVYPPVNTQRKSGPAPGCPVFGEDSVLERPADAPRDAGSAVRPGWHVPERGTHGVAWWDPHLFDWAQEEDAGVRQQKILAADASGVVASESERAHAAWCAKRESLLEAGSKPSLRVTTVTTVTTVTSKKDAADTAKDSAPVPIETWRTEAKRDGRPHGKRFGTLVHAVLATVSLPPTLDALTKHAEVHARTLGATDEERAHAIEAARAALAHPVLERAMRAKICRREAPVSVREEDGSYTEGVVDLAFFEEDRDAWTIIDFKTDGEMSTRQDAYAEQVAAYARAIALATGKRAAGGLLSV